MDCNFAKHSKMGPLPASRVDLYGQKRPSYAPLWLEKIPFAIRDSAHKHLHSLDLHNASIRTQGRNSVQPKALRHSRCGSQNRGRSADSFGLIYGQGIGIRENN